MVPVKVEDTSLSQQVVVGLRMRKRRQDGELRQVEIDLAEEINQALTVVLGLVVEAKKDGTLYPDAVIVIALHTLLDIVAGVVDGLIHIPGTGIIGELQHLIIVLDGVADPLLLQRGDGLEQFLLPLFVLCQRVVDDEEPVVLDGCHILYHLVDGTRTELAASQITHGTRIAAEAATTRGMEQIDHLHTLMVIQLTLIEVAATGAYTLDGRHLAHIVIHFLKFATDEVLHHSFHAAFALAKEQTVYVVHHLLGMQHRGDATGHHQFAALMVFVGNLPATLHLSGEHH